MIYSVMTDKGVVRSTNQDNGMATCPDGHSCYAVVCDGMGGAQAGDVASEIAVRTISERLAAAWRADMTAESLRNLLTTSITAANICVYDRAEEDPLLRGMGTTVVAAAIQRDRMVIAHVGDSRAYLCADGLRQLTRDHSVVQDMVDAGLLTQAQAAVHPNRNYITRALGVSERVEIDTAEFPFRDGETLLLCTDGLTNYVAEDAITEILSSCPPQEAARLLVEAANRNGGGDNVTAVVIRKTAKE